MYQNEYCSHCNGVSEILAWDTVVSCSRLIPDDLTFLSVLLFDGHSRIQQECKVESFNLDLTRTYFVPDFITTNRTVDNNHTSIMGTEVPILSTGASSSGPRM